MRTSTSSSNSWSNDSGLEIDLAPQTHPGQLAKQSSVATFQSRNDHSLSKAEACAAVLDLRLEWASPRAEVLVSVLERDHLRLHRHL